MSSVNDPTIKLYDASEAGEDCRLGHACSFCPKEPTCKLDKSTHNQQLVEKRLNDLGMVVLVMANKGGVGKSTVAANLAVSLTHLGYQVGLADADIHGPNAPRIFGLQEERVKVEANGIEPPTFQAGGDYELKLGSLAFFLSEDDTPVVWRDAFKHDYIHHMIGTFNWGALDFLIVDMPPGTGNELITLTDLLEGFNLRALLVSPADAIALQDTLKAARFCQERGVPIIGLVENYSGTLCPHCGSEIEMFPRSNDIDRFETAAIRTVARLPFAREIASGAALGKPAAMDSRSPIGEVFAQLARHCADCAIEEHRALLKNELSKLVHDKQGALDLPLDIQSEVQQMLETEKDKLDGRRTRENPHE